MNQGYISEIYASKQGEGPYTGENQIFVRLAGCPLRCDYCDTPDSLTTQGHPKRSSASVLQDVLALRDKNSVGTVSVTGGEPLAQAAFLRDLLPQMKNHGLKIYLETAGIHPQGLSNVIDFCDVVSMDIKLPSAVGRVTWKEHQEFLTIGKNKIFVKVVVEKHSLFSELRSVVALLTSLKNPPLLILQPVTPQPPTIEEPTGEQMSEFSNYARSKLPDVRIMSQLHPVWGIR